MLQTCDIDDEDEVQEIIDARTPMKKSNSGNMCVTCYQIFAKTQGMGKNPGKAHRALVQLLWQHFQRYKDCRHSHG